MHDYNDHVSLRKAGRASRVGPLPAATAQTGSDSFTHTDATGALNGGANQKALFPTFIVTIKAHFLSWSRPSRADRRNCSRKLPVKTARSPRRQCPGIRGRPVSVCVNEAAGRFGPPQNRTATSSTCSNTVEGHEEI